MDYTLYLDTNALLNLQEKAFEEPFVISQITLQEIEDIKTNSRKDSETKYKARNVARLLEKHDDVYQVIPSNVDEIYKTLDDLRLSATPDNIILASAKIITAFPILVVSDDINMRFISKKIFGLKTKSPAELNLVDDQEYIGYKEIQMSDDEMAYFYSHLDDNIYDLLINQYLIINNSDGDTVDYRCWNGETHRALNYKQINSDFMGRVKPRNNEQILAFDMLQDKTSTIKVLIGKMGSGKDFLQISNALRLVKAGLYDKIVYMRNPIQVKDIKEIGFIPGDILSKLKPVVMALADHVGGEHGLDMLIAQDKISVEHLGYMRGRTYQNCIVYISEAENLTKENMQLLISRIGEGSALWINGDFKQTDSPIFRINNGLLSAINCLKGRPEFGFVKLNKTERSKTAELAELLG